MKILCYKAIENSEAKTGGFLRRLEQLVCKFAYLVPNGWRCIAEMQVDGDKTPYWHIDVQSNKGGGNYASAKLNTLKYFSDLAATQPLEIDFLADTVKSRGGDAGRLKGFTSVDQMPDGILEWLRDAFAIAPCYGGIRVPYKDLIVDGCNISDESGEIRIVFSGASAEQDLLFAVAILKAMNDSFVNLYPEVQGWLNLRALREIPAVRVWLDLFRLEEA